MNVCAERTVIDTSRTGGRSRDWEALYRAATRVLAFLHPGDARVPVLSTIIGLLESSDRARRAGCQGTAEALERSANVLAVRMAGRWVA